jgi:hypothetical protein
LLDYFLETAGHKLKTMFYYIQALYLIICISEAWLEQVVIWLKNPAIKDYLAINKKEHARSAVYACTVAFSLVFVFVLTARDYVMASALLITLFIIRRIGFDFTLKLFRGKRVSLIEGTGSIDSVVKKIFGSRGGWIEFIVWVIVVGIINFLRIKYK